MKVKIKISQKSVVNFLIADMCVTSIKFFIIQSIPGLYVYNSLANVLISLVLILFLVPAYLETFRENPNFVMGSTFLFITVIVFQIILFPENASTIISYLPKIFGMSFGCLIAGYGLTDYIGFYKKLVLTTKIIIVFAAVQFVSHEFFGVRGTEILDYNMSFGFFIAVPAIIQFSSILYNNKKYLEIIFFTLSFIMAIVMGSRGSILTILLGCIVCYVQQIDLRRVKNFIFSIATFILLAGLYANYENIAHELVKILRQYNVNSRFLTMLLYGNITSATNRDQLQERILEKINVHPLMGSGMLCDLSSHNIFIEAFLFFGIPIGVIIIFVICFEWSKPLFERDAVKKIVMSSFLVYAVVDAMLNLTVIGKDIFWIYLGMAFSTKIFKRRRDK